MSRELHMRDVEGNVYDYDNIKTQGWLSGHVSGLDAAVGYIKTKAVELFKEGKDEEAKALRNFADEMRAKLEPGMRERTDEHEKGWPDIVQKASDADEQT